MEGGSVVSDPFIKYYTPEMQEAADNPPDGFNPFQSDGPSGPRFFHRVIFWLNPGFEEVLNRAAVEHDFSYWRGGTDEERLEADTRFREGLSQWPKLAEMYFRGVREMGGSERKKSYSWGYGNKNA